MNILIYAMAEKSFIVLKTKIKYWSLIIGAVAIGVILPFYYYRGAEIKQLLAGKFFAPRIELTNFFVADTYLSALNHPLIYASSTGRYYRRGREREPIISAPAFLVIDLETGQTVLERQPNRVYPIASITKLMTSIVSRENLNQNQVAVVSYGAMQTFGQAGQLRVGEKFKVGDLLYPLLLESSNKSAEVLAETGGRTNFLRQMNNKAETLGLRQTHFVDPSGLAPQNVSSVSDLAKLTKYVYDYHPTVLAITRKKTYSDYGRIWSNENKIVGMDHYLGGKDGFTGEAQRTVISLFSLPLEAGQERLVAVILLQSRDKLQDVSELLRYLRAEIYYAN